MAAALALLAGCAPKEQPDVPARIVPDTLWLLAPTPSQDAVRATDGEAELIARYGKDVVVRGRVDLGEGETVPGTILFPLDSTRRLQVHWKDTVQLRAPTRAVVNSAASRWRIYPGVGMQTSLQELEQLNGRPFVLTGMGWDYSGTVMSWNGGRLDQLWAPRPGHLRLVWLRLSRNQADNSAMMQVLGDRQYQSDLPAMARLNPLVYEMAIEPR